MKVNQIAFKKVKGSQEGYKELGTNVKYREN